MSFGPNDRTTNDVLSPANAPHRSLLRRLAGYVVLQLLALAIFVGFPALWTAIAPVSWIRFERRDGQVSATARTCLLFVVPFKTRTVAPVTGVGERTVGGTISRERRPGRDKVTQAEDEGFLIIQANDQFVEVPVTPFNLPSVIEQAEAFLNDPQAAECKLFVVANWKFSVIGGGLISLLTVLYAATLLVGVLLKAVHLFQWAVGVPPERRLLAKATH